MLNIKAPTKFGLLLYPGFEVLDVFGPLEALNVISRKDFLGISPVYIENVSLSIIAETNELVSPGKPGMAGSSLAQKITPEYTLENAPDLDVLLIPGGLGSGDVSDVVIQWLQNIFPSLQYLITVCTGADLAARAGLLNGLRATTNKMAWVSVLVEATSFLY
jgi:putative intracellular protease/amidase